MKAKNKAKRLISAVRRERKKERQHPAYKMMRECIWRVGGDIMSEDTAARGVHMAFLALEKKGEGLHIKTVDGDILYITRDAVARVQRLLVSSDKVPALTASDRDGRPCVVFFSEIADVVPLCDVPDNW
ncbi:hypothetical protein [Providencia phage Kokobel2]|nr:hypothetical protein [Providencia phage Kokobel2]